MISEKQSLPGLPSGFFDSGIHGKVEMLNRKQNTRVDSLPPILAYQGSGEISLGYTWPRTGFWIPDRSKRALMGYGATVKNDQVTAKRTAHNVRASLEYEHAEERFKVDPAAWLTADNDSIAYDDHADIEPGRMRVVALAVRRGNDAPFDTFAAKMKQNALSPAVQLRFGKWEVIGTVTADFADPVKFIVTFRIDEKGDVVDLQDLSEDAISLKDRKAFGTPEKAALKNQDARRMALIEAIRPYLDHDYSFILHTLDNSDRRLMEDRLFKKWVRDHKIQSWSDIADNKKARPLFQKFLSDVRRKMKQ